MPTPDRPRDPLATLAASASVGFREAIGRDELDAILTGHDVSEARIGHIMRIVDEMPFEMLAVAVASYLPQQWPAVLAGLRRLDAAYGATGRIARWLNG